MLGLDFKTAAVNKKIKENKKYILFFYSTCIQVHAIAPLYLSNLYQRPGNCLLINHVFSNKMLATSSKCYFWQQQQHTKNNIIKDLKEIKFFMAETSSNTADTRS